MPLKAWITKYPGEWDAIEGVSENEWKDEEGTERKRQKGKVTRKYAVFLTVVYGTHSRRWRCKPGRSRGSHTRSMACGGCAERLINDVVNHGRKINSWSACHVLGGGKQPVEHTLPLSLSLSHRGGHRMVSLVFFVSFFTICKVSITLEYSGGYWAFSVHA